jgi:hypothetical protein
MKCPCSKELKKTGKKEVNENFNEIYFEFGIWEIDEPGQLSLF